MKMKRGKDITVNDVMKKKEKVMRTIAMDVSWVCMGLFSEVTGPTLPFLKSRVQSDYEEISRALVARSIGFLVGALTGGVLCMKYPRRVDLWVAIALLVAGGATVAVPWCGGLALLGFLCCLDGWGKGILAAACNYFVLRCWGTSAAVPNHSLHFSFGIGALLAPQIVRPFLPHTFPAEGNSTINPTAQLTPNPSAQNTTAPPFAFLTNTDDVMLNGTNDNWAIDGATGRVDYAYAIIGGFTVICGVGFACVAWFKPLSRWFSDEESVGMKSVLKSFSPTSCLREGGAVGVVIVVVLFLFFALPIGAERAYGKFLYSFAVEADLLTPRDAANLETVFWTFFTLGRGLATLVSRWVGPARLVLAELLVNATSAAALAACGARYPIALWILSASFGMSLSPIFPGALAWANLNIDMTAIATGMAFIATAGGAFVCSWIAGYLFEYHGPDSIMYFILGNALFSCVVFAVLLAVTNRCSVARRPIHDVTMSVPEVVFEPGVNTTDHDMTQNPGEETTAMLEPEKDL